MRVFIVGSEGEGPDAVFSTLERAEAYVKKKPWGQESLVIYEYEVDELELTEDFSANERHEET